MSRSCAADSMGGVTSYIESYNASLSPLTHTLPDQHREFWDLYHTASMDHQNGIQIPDILIESILVDGLVDSGAGFFAMPEDHAEKLDKLGLEPLMSNLIGKNADGKTCKSSGKYDARFFYDIFGEDIANDANSICLNIESYGRNAFIIIPVIKLASERFRFIACEDEILGTYFVTPSNNWYKCRIERNVPFLDMKMDIFKNPDTSRSKLVISIAQ